MTTVYTVLAFNGTSSGVRHVCTSEDAAIAYAEVCLLMLLEEYDAAPGEEPEVHGGHPIQDDAPDYESNVVWSRSYQVACLVEFVCAGVLVQRMPLEG